MAKVTIRPALQVSIILELSEGEARALSAMTCYGIDEFTKLFYSKMGKHYLQPYESDLSNLFTKVAEMAPCLREIDEAKKKYPTAIVIKPNSMFGDPSKYMGNEAQQFGRLGAGLTDKIGRLRKQGKNRQIMNKEEKAKLELFAASIGEKFRVGADGQYLEDTIRAVDKKRGMVEGNKFGSFAIHVCELNKQ